MVDKHFRKSLRAMGYKIQEIPGDGNCLYSAIAQAVYGNMQLQHRVREEIFAYVSRNANYIAGFLGDVQDFVNELLEIKEDGKWGGEVSLRGACKVYAINFVVFSPNAPPRSMTDESDSFETVVNLSFHAGNHYNLLLDGGNDASKNSHDNDIDEQSTGDNMSGLCLSNCLETHHENEDINNISMDESRSDSEDNSETSSGEDELTSADGFPFLACKSYSSGRDFVDVVIIIPEENGVDNLFKQLLKSKPDFMYILFDYGSELLCNMKKERHFSDDYTAYCHRATIPWKKKIHDRKTWISHMIFPFLILFATRFKWNGIEIKFLGRHSSKSLIIKLLNYYWKNVRKLITDDVKSIMDRQEKLFCHRCDQSCCFAKKLWHFETCNFQKVTQDSDIGDGFWKDTLLIEDNCPSSPFIVKEIKKIYKSPQRNRLEFVYKSLDKNYELHRNDWWCSYLVIVFDGPTMMNHKQSPIHVMLKDKKVRKSLYAGSTVNEMFRSGHFSKNSAIANILTKDARIFFLRKEKFTKWGNDDARQDEAFVIELLKMVLNYHWENRLERPFLLLNRNSECKKLFSQTNERKHALVNFPKSGIPVFNMDPNDTRKFNFKNFRGNFEIGPEIPKKSGPHALRDYNDAIDKKYKTLATTRPR